MISTACLAFNKHFIHNNLDVLETNFLFSGIRIQPCAAHSRSYEQNWPLQALWRIIAF